MKTRILVGTWLLALVVAWLPGLPPALAETGVTDKEILIGIVDGTTGPIAASGLEINAGTSAYIDRINKEGGVLGRKIVLKFYDDGYEPARTIAQTRKALDEDKVFALMDCNGTPTTKAALPIVISHNVPFLFSRTGDEITRTTKNPNIVNLRGSFEQEMEVLVHYLVEKRGLKKIGILTQSDAFGTSMRSAAAKALTTRSLSLVVDGSVERNSKDVKSAFDKIAGAAPEAVILGVTAAAAVPFVEMTRAQGKSWVIGGANNNNPITEKLGSKADGILLTEVTPHPDARLPVAEAFRRDMKAAGHEKLATLVSFETYLNAVALVKALEKAGKDLTRDGLRKAFEDVTYDLGGVQAKFSASDRSGSLPISLMKIEGGKIVEFEK